MIAATANGNGDVEVPAPADGVGDHAAEQRAADGGDGHDRAEQAHVATAVARRDDVGHRDLHEGGESAGAEALQHAEEDQHLGALREPGEAGTDDEDDQRDLDEQLAVGQVGELAPDRGADSGRASSVAVTTQV